MSTIIHERPGVYSSYDASSMVSGGSGAKTVGVAARASAGDVGAVKLITGYAAGVAAFGEDGSRRGMSTILKLLFRNGATAVRAVRVADEDPDYAAAFTLLGSCEDVQIVVCDSADITVQQTLRESVAEASVNRRERIAVVGGAGENVEQLTEHAAALNSERMVLVGPDALDEDGTAMQAVFAAAAVAGAIAAGGDPAVPLNGAALYGMGGLSAVYTDNDIDTLVRGGVLPLESIGGVISPVRGITTRTSTGGAADATWRELTTILIVDDVIPAVRNALRSRFARTKNTAQTRSAIRSQVIVELERKLAAQIIDSYGEVKAAASAEDPTVCEVEFSFAVAHGLNQIYLTAHITV